MASTEKEFFAKGMSRLIDWLVWIMSLIPFRMGQFFGRMLAKAFGIIPVSRTKVSLDGLRNAFGDQMAEAEIKILNRRVVMHFGQMLFEIPHILRLTNSNLHRYVEFENVENLLSAIGKGKGVYILSGHFGNWELMAAAVALKFAPKTAVVARPIDFAPADRVIGMLRSRFGTEIIPKKGAVRRVMKAVRENKMVGILLDQNVDWYDGVFVSFLGRPACTNKGLALMALKTGSPVIPAFSVRQPDGRYRIIFEKEVELCKTGDKTRDIEENTALFTGSIESYVNRYPDHWFWFHRRWKTIPFCPLPDCFR